MRERLKGYAEFVLKPGLKESPPPRKCTGPLNGQRGRQQVVAKIIKAMRVEAIIETGTNRGTTTRWLAGFGVPVHTVELNPRRHAYCSLRLRRYRNISVHLGPSVDVLKDLSADRSVPKDRVFFYLDAHWGDMVPVEEELDLVFSYWRRAVVMIDDFKVPDDSYSYYDHGPGKVIDQRVLRNLPDLPQWFPAIPAYQESGYNTGWTVLASRDIAGVISGVPGLRVG